MSKKPIAGDHLLTHFGQHATHTESLSLLGGVYLGLFMAENYPEYASKLLTQFSHACFDNKTQLIPDALVDEAIKDLIENCNWED